MDIGSIPERRYFCKVCLQRGARVYMDDIACGRIRCPACGRTVVRPDQRSRRPILRSVDPVRFRTRGVGFGIGGVSGGPGGLSSQGNQDSFSPRIYHKKTKRARAFLKPKLPEPEAEIFDTSDEYQIVVRLPQHKDLEDTKCEIDGTKLILKSLVIDYKEEFTLPESLTDLTDFEKTLKNGILTLSFKKG